MSVLFKYNQPLMNSLNYMWKMSVVCYNDSKLSLFGRLGTLQSLYSCYRPSTTAHEQNGSGLQGGLLEKSGQPVDYQ